MCVWGGACVCLYKCVYDSAQRILGWTATVLYTWEPEADPIAHSGKDQLLALWKMLLVWAFHVAHWNCKDLSLLLRLMPAVSGNSLWHISF